jgi:hypothetical protein
VHSVSVAFPFLQAIAEQRFRLRFRFSRQSPTFCISESGTDARFPSEVRHFVCFRHPLFGHGVVSVGFDPLVPESGVVHPDVSAGMSSIDDNKALANER